MTTFTVRCVRFTILALAVATVAGATTIQNFDGGGTAFTLTQHWSPPTAAVIGGGPDGNFLRLANAGVNDQLRQRA